MAALPDVDDLAVVHLRTAVVVRHCQVCESAEHVEPCEDAAVLLDHGYARLDPRHELRIYLHLKGIDALLRSEDLLLILLKLLSDISFRIDQGLLSDPFRRNAFLVCVAYFEIISEDVVEAYLQGRYSRTLYLSLLHFQQVILAVTGDLAEFVQFLVHAACYDVALAQLGCGLGMHCLSEVVQQLGAVAHLREHLVKRLHSPSAAQPDDRRRLAQASAQLHHLARHDLACRRPRYDALQVADVPYHGLQTHQVFPVVHKMLHHIIAILQFLQIHHRHRQPCAQHSRAHRRRAFVHHLDQRGAFLAGCRCKDFQVAEREAVHPYE